MHSSTSNSNFQSTSLTPKVFVFTIILLVGYWEFIKFIGWNVTVAETNSNAGLLRLQSLADSKSPSAITVGSSIIAKLDQKVIFKHFNGDIINMGLDGGSTVFAMKKILESNTYPKKILLETNRILIPPNKNMETLDNIVNSVIFKMSEFFPILRREYRPVTYLYSKLKKIKDENNFKRGKTINITSTIPIEYPSKKIILNKKMTNIETLWDNVIPQFQKHKVSIVLVMIPDSNNNNRHKEYIFSRNLASKYNLPFIDLKKYLDNNGLIYSDRAHLSYNSAQKISEIINGLLLTSQL